MEPRPWFSISWFAAWGLFQTFAVASLLAGRWDRPEAFPEGPYNALVWPDILFIPLYLTSALLFFRRRRAGLVVAVFAGGAVTYVMVYLLALSRFQGFGNVIGDSVFLLLNGLAVIQTARRLLAQSAS